MEFSRKYFVHYYEADSSRRLSLPSLLQYFEDIAILDSSNRGMDLDYYHANNCGWMLLKWDIVIHVLPVFGDTVTVSTHVHSMKRFLADRAFSLTASNGTPLAEGHSNWLLADTVKRRPMRIPEERYKIFGISLDSEADFVSIADVPALEDTIASPPAFRKNLQAGNTDADTNLHVNNVRYVNWALDSLPRDFLEGAMPSAIRVQYKKELVPGESAEVLTLVSGMTSRHTIRKGNDEISSMEIFWKKT